MTADNPNAAQGARQITKGDPKQRPAHRLGLAGIILVGHEGSLHCRQEKPKPGKSILYDIPDQPGFGIINDTGSICVKFSVQAGIDSGFAFRPDDPIWF